MKAARKVDFRSKKQKVNAYFKRNQELMTLPAPFWDELPVEEKDIFTQLAKQTQALNANNSGGVATCQASGFPGKKSCPKDAPCQPMSKMKTSEVVETNSSLRSYLPHLSR